MIGGRGIDFGLGGTDMSLSHSGAVARSRRASLVGIATFLAIFAFYALASSTIVALLGNAGTLIAIGPVGLELTVYWMTIAVLAGMLCVVLSIWSVTLLRRQVDRRTFAVVGLLMLGATLIGAALSVDSPGGLMAFPKAVTCGPAPLVGTKSGFLCDRDLTIGWHRLFVDEGWIGAVLRLRLGLNILFQTAAIAILGAMVAIASIGRAKRRPELYYRRLARSRVMTKLLGAAAAILSARVLSEIIFANWPIAVIVPDPADPDRPVIVGLLTAYIFFFSALGTIILGLTLLYARQSARGAIWSASDESPTEWGAATARIGGFLTRDTTLKALMTLSPILTAVIGNPIVAELLKGLHG